MLVSLFQAGQYGLLEERAHRLLAEDPKRGVVWKLYAASLAMKGAWQEALPAMLRATELLPEEAEGFANLGLAWFHAGKSQEAIQACQKALSLDPETGSAWGNLGIILRNEGRLEEAFEHQLKAASLTPGSAQVHGNLGIVSKELGRFEASINHFRQALILQFTHLKTLPPAALLARKPGPGRPVMPKTEAYQTLDVLRECLDAAGIPWCLVAGTLLGVHRDGDLLPNDKDLDVGIPAGVERARLESLLCNRAGFIHLPQVAIPMGQRNRHSMSFMLQATGVTLDVIFIHEEQDGRMVLGLDHVVSPMVCRIRHFEIGFSEWRGRQWPVPIPTESYLEDIYGPGWVRPDPGFDTVLSNPNRVPEAMPPTLCYGYSCLCYWLLEGNLVKSRAYCRQLLARIQDPLLKELGAWLESLEGNT